LILLFVCLACAEVSQEGAGNICGPYAGEGETIQVLGPISCEGEYWICEFMYFGNRQRAMVAVEKLTGAVLGGESDLFADVVSASFVMGEGKSQIFDIFLNSQNFAIELEGMNQTLLNYEKVLKSLKKDEYITLGEYDDFIERMGGVKTVSSKLSSNIVSLNELSADFWDSPDCVELISYLRELNQSLVLAENFSDSWDEFIERYNTLAASLEDVYVATINQGDAQIMAQSIASVRENFEDYQGDVEAFEDDVIGNLGTRAERKGTKDLLDQAYEEVKGSKNPNAVERYQAATRAFSNGEYTRSQMLAMEAISLADIIPPTEEPPIVVEKTPDYTIFFIAIAVLMFLILAVSLYRRGKRQEGVEGEEGEKPAKKTKKKSWVWTKGKESSMEKRASKGSLDSQ
jgi:hypothetical protein